MNREQRKALAEEIITRLTDEWREHATAGLADVIADRQTTAAPARPAAPGANVVPFARRRTA